MKRLYDTASLIIFLTASCALLLLTIGIAYHSLPINSEDLTEMATIYEGISRHGLLFPLTWHYNQDNQLLTLVPFSYIFYSITGVSINSIIAQGWSIFVLNAMVVGFVVAAMTRSWRFGLLAWLLSLCATPSVIGWPIILAYPVTHNSAWFYAMIGFYLIASSVNTTVFARGAIFVLTFIGTLSDPWFLMAFTFPMILSLYKCRKSVKPNAGPIIKTIIIGFAAGSIGGLLLTLYGVTSGTSVHIAPPQMMVDHFIDIFKTIGMFFHFYPTPEYPELYFVIVAYSIALFTMAIDTTKYYAQMRSEWKLFYISLGSSALAMGAVYIITNYVSSGISVRYLLNFYYIGITLFALSAYALWSQGKILQRIAVAVSISGYAILGLSSPHEFDLSYQANTGHIHNLVKFMDKNHLSQGYSTIYWGFPNPAVLRLLSDDKISLHTLGNKDGYLVPAGNASSDIWYNGKIKENPSFVMTTKDVRSQLSVIKTFGSPKYIISYEAYNFYIYKNNIFDKELQAIKTANADWRMHNAERNATAIQRTCGAIGIQCGSIVSDYIHIIR